MLTRRMLLAIPGRPFGLARSAQRAPRYFISFATSSLIASAQIW